MNSNRVRGDRDEKRFAQNVGGKRIAGSGSSKEKKGDVKVRDFLVQNKSSVNKSIAVKRHDLENIQDQALNTGRYPAYVMSFYDGPYLVTQWVAIPIWLADDIELFHKLIYKMSSIGGKDSPPEEENDGF